MKPTLVLQLSLISACLLYQFAFGYDRPSHYNREVKPVDANKEMIDVYEKLTKHKSICDSLGVKTDSLRDDLFFAYDSVGGQVIGGLETDPINLDTEQREDDIYSHASDDYAVAVNATGWYRIVAQVSCYPQSGGSAGAAILYVYRYSGGWAEIPGFTCAQYAPGIANAYQSLGVDFSCELIAGDSIAIYLFTGMASDDFVTLGESVRLTIEKLH